MVTEAAANHRVIKVPVNFQGTALKTSPPRPHAAEWCRNPPACSPAASISVFHFIFALWFLMRASAASQTVPPLPAGWSRFRIPQSAPPASSPAAPTPSPGGFIRVQWPCPHWRERWYFLLSRRPNFFKHQSAQFFKFNLMLSPF